MTRGICLCAYIYVAFQFIAAANARELRFEMASDRDAVVQVFFGRTMADFSEVNSVVRPLSGDGKFHQLQFPIPDWEKLALRIDPGGQPGKVMLRAVELSSAGGRAYRIPVSTFESLNQIVPTITDDGDTLIGIVPDGSNDPILGINEVFLANLLHQSHRVSKGEFLLVCLGLALIVVLSALGALRWALSPDLKVRRLQVGIGLGLGLFVFGARLALLSEKVSWAPYLDQFEGELGTLIRPFQHGVFHWSDFAEAHNDHRIVTTRVASLAIYLINGEWDNRVLAVANCALHGLCVAWFAFILLRELRLTNAAAPLLLAISAAWMLNDWANITSGFQIQFYFVLLPSLVCVALMPSSSAAGVPTWIGFGAGVFAAGSMGGGFLGLAAGCAGLVLRMWMDRRMTTGVIVVLALSVGVLALAWISRPSFPALDDLHARSATHWLYALWTYGAWPFAPQGIWFVLLWLPWAVLSLRIILRRRATSFELAVLTLGLWLLLQSAALAYGRAGFAPTMSSRYTGILTWNGILAVTSVTLLCSTGESSCRWVGRFSLLPIALAIVIGSALLSEAVFFLGPQYTGFAKITQEHESRLGTFMQKNDAQVFAEVEFPRKPYPFTDRLVNLLRDPEVAKALPAPLRRDRFRYSNPEAFAAVSAGVLTHAVRLMLRWWFVFAGAGLLVTAVALRGYYRAEPKGAHTPT